MYKYILYFVLKSLINYEFKLLTYCLSLDQMQLNTSCKRSERISGNVQLYKSSDLMKSFDISD